LEEPSERRIWKTGKGSYVTALPKSWASKLGGSSVMVSEYMGGLFILPPESTKPLVRKLIFNSGDANNLRYELISGYLNNYREVLVELPKPQKECITALESLPEKLLGVSVSFASSNSFMVSMSTMPKPIPEIMQQMLSQCQAIHETAQQIFSTFELSTHELQRINAIENDIDRNSFLIKRLFCVGATQLGRLKELGIDDLTKMIHWENLNSNLERVGDLEFEICLELKRLLEKFKKKELEDKLRSIEERYSFKEYHNSAQEMVMDAYSNEPKKIALIIDTKRPSKEYEITKHRGSYISEKEGNTIRDLVNRTPDLACLDVRIWGITGCATNIAESWLNMRGPSVQ
jgi:phosphate uptake regulator